jgi:hypothetical protein
MSSIVARRQVVDVASQALSGCALASGHVSGALWARRQRVACIADYARPYELPPLVAKLVFVMSQSLDGYVDDAAGTPFTPPPSPALFRHSIDVVAGHTGAIYGRRIYEVMRYLGRRSAGVGRGAAGVRRHLETATEVDRVAHARVGRAERGADPRRPRRVRARSEGDGRRRTRRRRAAAAPLIDEHRLYFRPYVLSGGKPDFAGARWPLRLVATDRIGEDVVRLTYVPA